MTSLVRKVGLLVILGASAAGYMACSNNSGDTDGGSDTGTDGTMNGDGPNNGDGGKNDSSPPTTCEAGIPGTCDIVAQNCGSGMECDLVQLDGGAWATACVKNTTGNIAEGAKCTPGGSSNPCLAGLECISDGTSGRCSKRCCLGDNGACGASVPEGYQGSCDLGIVPNGLNNTVYYVCDYLSPCQPFGQQPCTVTGTECIVKDGFGDSKCTPIYPSPPGKPEKASCMSENECASGMGCYQNSDGGGFTCQWNCYAPGTMGGPFDAGISKLGAGMGGCPNGEKCQMINWAMMALPSWLGLCQ